MICGASKKLRIAIIGGCQVSGLGAAVRQLLPEAEVKSWHVGVHPKDSDDDLLVKLRGFDAVISQISDWDTHVALRITRLRDMRLPVIYLPVLVFSGFHPDCTYLRGPSGLIAGLGSDYHSTIVAAAFVLGVSEKRVPELFNSYIFAELGYFEVFEVAKEALISNFEKEGFNLRPYFDCWLKVVGKFMYTINHPHIFALATLSTLVLKMAGYIDASVLTPTGIDDYLSTHTIWPLYPSLAKRLNILGETTFMRQEYGLAVDQSRLMTLQEYTSGIYRLYENLPAQYLRTVDVIKVCERLELLGLRA